ESQKDVGGKKSAEEHHFRREKQPNADLGVPKTGVGTRGDCIRNLHLFSLHKDRFGGRLAANALGRFHRFILHRVIALATRKAVFVRTAIGDGGRNEIHVWRWRRGGPLQSSRVHRSVVLFFAVL